MIADATATGSEAESFWKKRLIALQPLTLPFNQLELLVPGQGARGKRRVTIPQEIGTLPATLSKTDVLVAVFSAFLSRLLNIHSFDILYANTSIPHNNAVSGETALKYLPLHVYLDSEITFEEACRSMQEELRRLSEYENCLPAVISETSDLRTALDDFEKSASVGVVLVDCLEDFKSSDTQHMTLVISKSGAECIFFYDGLILNQNRISRLLHHFAIFLRGTISNPSLRLSELPLLDERDQRQLLWEFNDTKMGYPKDTLLQDMFEEQVEKTPNNDAVIFEDKKITYRELNERSNQLARRLRERGVRPEQIVGLMVDDNSIEMTIGMMGIVKAGGAFLPIDSKHPKDRIAYMIEDSKVTILITQNGLKDEIQFKGETICLEIQSLFTGECSNLEKINQPNDLVYVIYTSGSTGKPKGVQIEHTSIVNQIYGLKTKYKFESALHHILLASITFDPSVQQIFLPLTTGGRLFLVPNSTKQSGKELWEFIVSNQIDVVNTVPSLMSILLNHVNSYSDVHFRYIILAGEIFSKKLYLRLKESLSAEKIINIYGPTEATINSTLYECRPEEISSTIPIGKPLINYNIMILDAHQNLLPIDAPGEICISGVGLARGYLNNPKLTAEKFVSNPFTPGERIYRTGDLGRWTADGNIEFLGRIDHQVKLRGFRIELGEIEAVLGQHPAVRETIVIAREDQPGDKRLAAYVTVRKGLTISTKELKSTLKQKLPEYMVPFAVVILDALPLTANGKVDRRALPIPESGRPVMEEPLVPPRTPIEETLAGIWCEVLGLKEVGIHDNFFELGGHSLLATQFMSRLSKVCQVEIPLRRLFELPTIAGLAGAVSTALTAREQRPEPLIVPVPREGGLQLSFAQESLWFLDQLDPSSSAYNIPLAVRLSGPLNVGALEESIGEILRRHEVLRSTFSTEKGQPVQRITHATAFTLSDIDLSAIPRERREAEAKRCAREEASLPFDLAAGPLLRVTLVRLDTEDHVLLLTMHHIVSDGWSMGILYRELSILYEAFLQGKPSPLPDLPIQYSDFAAWQREWLQGERLETQLAYWKEQLRDITTLELSTDRHRPSVQTLHGAAHTVQLSRDLTEALKDLSRKEGATLFMTVLAAFQSLLHRYTGQDDIVVGTPIANRNRAEIEELIGFIVNTLVIRTDTSGNPVFRGLLQQVRKSVLDAFTHQDLPFEKLIQQLKPDRELSRNPLFQVMFAMQNAPVSTLELPSLTVNQMEIETTRTRFDLEVYLWEESEKLRGSFVYSTDLFGAATIERMAGHYQRILEGIVADPDQRLSELPLLTNAERHQLLVGWNEAAADYPRDKCIHELFEAEAGRSPDAVAVVSEDRQLTYRRLNDKANQLAHYLRKQGVGPEVLVGICVERSLEMVIGVLGILKAGGAYVPLDPTYPKERLGFMIEDTRTPAILTQRHLLNVLPEHTANVICIDEDLKIITEESKDNPFNETAPDNLAYVMYTSGSTGRPKGVCVPHRGVVRLVKETNYARLTPQEVFLQLASISFDASTFEIWGSLLNGAKLVVMPSGTPSLEELEQALRTHRITTLWLTCGLFHLMVDEKPDAFGHVRQLLAGGDVLSVSHVRSFLLNNRNCTLINGYGPTENTTFTCCHTIEMSGQPERSVPIGRPIANTRIYVLDDWLQPVPVGVPGELHIGGDGLARGYLNQPGLTAGKFIPDPFGKEPGARLYKSGDLVRYLPDGNVEFLGRIDNQVKIRGYRIELGEIEAVLGQHPYVKETTVVVREARPGDKRLVAYVVLSEKSAGSTNDLRNFLQTKLPDYMLPAAFVILDSLPLTPNGKVDRRAFPAPDHSTLEAGQTYVAPRNKLEIQLTEIWEKILGVHPIGVTHNFFDLGGHSLLAVQLTSEIRKITSKDFPVMALFHNQTIGQLAEIIAGRKWSVQWSSAVPIHTGGSKKALFTVHDTNMARFLEPDQPLYILTHPSKDENLAPYNTVEKIAANNLMEMRTVQANGPYIIGGFCFWAIIALEMAHQLTLQGEEVSLLFLVDPSDIVRADQPLQNTNLKSGVIHHSRNLTSQKNGEKIASLLQKAFHRIRRRTNMYINMIKVATCEMYLRLGLPLPHYLRSFYFPDYYVKKIMKNYIPKAYSGKAVLFFADTLLPGTGDKWKNIITGGVEIHTVTGAKHLNILREPYVGMWAKQLNAYLKKVQTAKESRKA